MDCRARASAAVALEVLQPGAPRHVLEAEVAGVADVRLAESAILMPEAAVTSVKRGAAAEGAGESSRAMSRTAVRNRRIPSLRGAGHFFWSRTGIVFGSPWRTAPLPPLSG